MVKIAPTAFIFHFDPRARAVWGPRPRRSPIAAAGPPIAPIAVTAISMTESM